MLLSKIVEHLESIAPLKLARDDDTVGLILGDLSKEITTVGVSWAITPYVLDEAGIKDKQLVEDDEKMKKKRDEKPQLFILHEYPFFERESSTFLSLFEDPANYKRVKPLIREDVALYVMHSNLDETDGGTADIVSKSIELKITERFKCGRIGEIKEMTTEDLLNKLKTTFVLDVLRVGGKSAKRKIRRVGIYTGNGLGDFSTIESFYIKGVDALISYGLSVSTAQYANEIGLQLIEIDSSKVERTTMQNLTEKLQLDLRGTTVIYYDCEETIEFA